VQLSKSPEEYLELYSKNEDKSMEFGEMICKIDILIFNIND
jgi:hypothetical protein